jgi:hypothetical protein
MFPGLATQKKIRAQQSPRVKSRKNTRPTVPTSENRAPNSAMQKSHANERKHKLIQGISWHDLKKTHVTKETSMLTS